MNLFSELNAKLQTIHKVFTVKKILSLPITKDYIKKYYEINKLPYSLFHTSTNMLHMGISRNGIYKEGDLLEVARIVKKYLVKLKAKNVLELAIGKGATSFYLASRFKNIRFYGIDLSSEQIKFARKRAKKADNYYPEEGDYHNLRKFSERQFDTIFIVEALCHSSQKEKVLEEVHRILRKGGVFIIFDGYLKKSYSALNKQERLAKKLTERALAVQNFEEYSSFLKKARAYHFTIEEEDVSRFILPTLYRFENLAKIFFTYPFLAKLIIKIFPKEFTYNTISGLLMPTLIKLGVGGYFITILKK